MRQKSPTDDYWNRRALDETDESKVNMPDTVQRDLELQFVFNHLQPNARVVEIGCGNGFVSRQIRQQVAHLDAFDFAENMVDRARQRFGETNNRFFHESVLFPRNVASDYDIAICVRVLMNLRDLTEQKVALSNIADMLRSSGKLILIEGYRDGFDHLSKYRNSIGLTSVKPAAHNFYPTLQDVMPEILKHFLIERTWHTGLFDFLTRIVYPALVGAENATTPGDFHNKIEPVVRAFEGSDLTAFARVHGFLLVKR